MMLSATICQWRYRLKVDWEAYRAAGAAVAGGTATGGASAVSVHDDGCLGLDWIRVG